MNKPHAVLVEQGIKGGNSPKHYWTEEEREIVRRDYNGHNDSVYSIANRLGVTFCAVKGQVQMLGIAQDKSPRWTSKEEDKLKEMITQYAPITIAHRLGRSLNSVVVKSKRLHCSRRVRDGWFTKSEVSEICGVDHKKAQRWIDSGDLKAGWHTGVKPQKNGGSCWHIRQTDLRDFLIRHSCELQGRNVDLFTITHILVGGNGRLKQIEELLE